MSWEARRNAVESGDVSDGQAGWLTRMHFRGDGDRLAGRIVGMPCTIGDARLIAALASFLLEHAYDLPENSAVSIALEAA